MVAPVIHAQAVANLHLIELHLLLGAVIAQPPGKVGREFQKIAYGLARLAHRPKLQDVAEDHESHDDRSSLEVCPDRSVVLAELRRKEVGQEDRDQAEKVGEAHAQTDQRVHIEGPACERRPELAQDRPAHPRHDRCPY